MNEHKTWMLCYLLLKILNATLFPLSVKDIERTVVAQVQNMGPPDYVVKSRTKTHHFQSACNLIINWLLFLGFFRLCFQFSINYSIIISIAHPIAPYFACRYIHVWKCHKFIKRWVFLSRNLLPIRPRESHRFYRTKTIYLTITIDQCIVYRAL